MPQNLKEKLLQTIVNKGEANIQSLIKITGFTRAYLNRFLNQLIAEKKIVRVGRTNQTRYLPKTTAALRLQEEWSRALPNKNLNESKIFAEFARASSFYQKLPKNTARILEYAFTEMMNNAIEHSQSSKVRCRVWLDKQFINFTVEDRGVGVFQNVMKKKNLRSELEAAQDVLKGKQTTAPELHSGEGIFFTSKVADKFEIASGATELIADNTIPDIFIKPRREKKGSIVNFSLAKKTNKQLRGIFEKFSEDEIGFDKTEIKVKLFAIGANFMSRSEARRLLAGLEEFTAIILDFDRVTDIGQGFADEIFRVYKNNHPDKRIQYFNASEQVEFMIKWVTEKP